MKKASPKIVVDLDVVLVSACALGLIALIVQSGYNFRLSPLQKVIFALANYLIIAAFLVDIGVHYALAPSKWQHFRRNILDMVIVLPLLLSLVSVQTSAGLIIVRQAMVLAQLTSRMRKAKRLLTYLQMNPAQLLGLSFAGLIFVGSILLTFPAATKDGYGASMLTALFTATSATCVTGLVVVDTGTHFSTFGQIVILCLIQLGGLGMMTFSTSLALIFGKRLGVRERATMQEVLDAPDPASLIRIVRYIVKMTVCAELIGATILFVRFKFVYPSVLKAAYYALFHAISAFCNAGFGLYSDSLTGFHGDLIVNFTITTLIIMGGIGFVVVAAVTNRENLRRGVRGSLLHLDVHSKLVLSATAVLIVGGALAVFFFEFDRSLLTLSTKDKFLAAYFQSVTARTAGFNTIDIGQLRNVTLFIMMVWMFVGAAPGSTGGGIKVSTVAVLLLSLKTMLQERRDIEVFRRTIPQPVVYKSIAVTIVSLLLLGSLFSLLLVSQDGKFVDLLFEAVSAFGTVGLSVGVTPQLNAAGRVIIMLLMFIGRLGPLTLAFAVGRRSRRSYLRYPQGRVMIG
ncbi:MAG: TrkH family potassium uptake protein [Candidatus Latescibacterota bacterium]